MGKSLIETHHYIYLPEITDFVGKVQVELVGDEGAGRGVAGEGDVDVLEPLDLVVDGAHVHAGELAGAVLEGEPDVGVVWVSQALHDNGDHFMKCTDG